MGSDSVALSSLTAGMRAEVVSIEVLQPSKGRLMEMGLLTGTSLEIVRFAPMGDPMEIKVRGYHLTLRRSDADLIKVRSLP